MSENEKELKNIEEDTSSSSPNPMTPGDKDFDDADDVGGDGESSSTEEQLSLTSPSTTETPNVSPVIGLQRMPIGHGLRPELSAAAYHAALMSTGSGFQLPFFGQSPYHSLMTGSLWPNVPPLGLWPPTYFSLSVMPKLAPPVSRIQSMPKKEPPRATLLTPTLPVPPDPSSHVEWVNGGYGIKNPLVKTGGPPPDIDPTPAPTTETNSFICRTCGKKFQLQRLLNRHAKCHSDIKRYLCTFCGKGFNDTFDLKRHTRTHTGVRPYKCDRCDKSFTQRCSLESHLKKVHAIQHCYAYKERRSKVFVCEECGFTSTDLEVYLDHVRQNHPLSATMLKYDKRHLKSNGCGTSVSSTTTDNDQDDSRRAMSTDSSVHSMD